MLIIARTALAALPALACLSDRAAAQQAAGPPEAPHVAVVGTGRAEAPPGFAELRFGFELAGESVAELAADVDERVRKLVAALERLAVPPENVRPGELTIDSEYEQREGALVLTGYRAARDLELRLDRLEIYGEVLERAIAAGVTRFYGAAIRSGKEQELKRRARARAVEDARAQAEALAAAFGAGLAPVYSITTSGARRAARAGVFGEPDDGLRRLFRPGPVEVQQSVYVVFLLRDRP